MHDQSTQINSIETQMGKKKIDDLFCDCVKIQMKTQQDEFLMEFQQVIFRIDYYF